VLDDLARLFRHRQLIAALTARDLKARYRGSVLGFFWSLANPLLLLGVYTLVFTRFAVLRASVEAYPLFLFAGILPWAFFAGAILESTGSIGGNAGLIKKVLFPAEALPIVVVLSHLVHFALALPILGIALVAYTIAGKAQITPLLLIVPLVMLLQTIFIAGLALVLSPIAVLFRDLRDLTANLLQLGFFLTPILYPLHDIGSTTLRILLRFNPMTPFVASFQNIVVFARPPAVVDVALMVGWAAATTLAGLVVFDRLRDTLAEAI
jgi:lipopolysaccharide transport system permease protein